MPINKIFIRSDEVINVDKKTDITKLILFGWQELTPEQIEAAGMLGYEHLVSPANTIVNADGGITFTPPAPQSEEERFNRLRIERDTRINSVLWMRERHADEIALGKETSLTPEQCTELLTYIQALRDLPAQPGAPWDGGGELTPWPELPKT